MVKLSLRVEITETPRRQLQRTRILYAKLREACPLVDVLAVQSTCQ
jgi:hypothetical protein